MWVFRNDALVSLIAGEGAFLARARRRGDIERVFGSVPVREAVAGDYGFCALIDCRLAAAAIGASVDAAYASPEPFEALR